MEARCRLCAEPSHELLNALEIVEFPTKILQLFHVKISIEDRLPTIVCQLCCEMVNHTWEFLQHVQKSQHVLLEILENEEKEKVANPDDNVQGTISEILVDISQPQTSNKRSKTKDPLADDDSELSEFETSTDGNIIPKREVEGWDAYAWMCNDCEHQLPNADDLKDHHQTIHGQTCKYACLDCPKVYMKYTTFLAHVRDHRPKLRFTCDLCGKWFGRAKEVERHRNAHSDERPYGCETCGKNFRMQSALMVHARCHLPVEVKNRHQCDECPKRFGTKPNLMAHKKIHLGIREFTCDQCGKSFVQKGNLDNHMLTHVAARPFSCKTCGKSFKTRLRLRKHDTVHTGLKPYQCDTCGRQFRERGTLKEHHRIHTGAMPFKCEFCGKSFRFKGVLTTHRRQHTGERPYSCHECQHHFTNWPNYNKHMKRRHGINTSVTVRKPQTIPPTGMPQRNPPGTVLAPPQPVAMPENFDSSRGFYSFLNLYGVSEEIIQQQQRVN